jgi:hypothetical protein
MKTKKIEKIKLKELKVLKDDEQKKNNKKIVHKTSDKLELE